MMFRFVVIFSVALVGVFFWAGEFKSGTRVAKRELASVQTAIEFERDKVRVLKAEWSHRTEPTTLRRLSEAHLGLSAVRIEQIAAIEDVPYLGMNLDDEEYDAMPVDFAATPRQKPSGFASVMPEQNEEAQRQLALAPVEYVVAGPVGLGRKEGGR